MIIIIIIIIVIIFVIIIAGRQLRTRSDIKTFPDTDFHLKLSYFNKKLVTGDRYPYLGLLQFLNLLTLNDSFQLMRINQRYRKYHPNVSLKVSPRSWWLYAYSAVLEEVIRPYSWERIKEHR